MIPPTEADPSAGIDRHLPHTAVRRLPLPPTAPPYDDERTGGRSPEGDTQGALALAFSLGNGLPVLPEAPAQLRLVPDPHPQRQPQRVGHGADLDPGVHSAGVDDGFAAHRPTPSSELPEPRAWTVRLVQAVLEILAGQRPPQQLLRWTSDAVYADLSARVLALARRPEARRRRSPQVRLRAVHLCEPVDGVVEVTAVVQTGGRFRAMALRLEGMDGRWQCTVLQLV